MLEHLKDVRTGIEARLNGVQDQGGNNQEAEKKLNDYPKALADLEAKCNQTHEDILSGKFVISQRLKRREEEVLEEEEKEKEQEQIVAPIE